MLQSCRGWEFDCELTGEGVRVILGDKFKPWEDYLYQEEFEEYLAIRDRNGDLTFLPKTEAMKEIVEFTKSKIPNKSRHRDGQSAADA